MLAQTVASLEGIYDELLIADGLIDGVDGAGYPALSDPTTFPEGAHVSAHRWPTQSSKRTWLLQKAQQLGCDWLLQIDADERLHGATKLRDYLAAWGSDAVPNSLRSRTRPDTWRHLEGAALRRLGARRLRRRLHRTPATESSTASSPPTAIRQPATTSCPGCPTTRTSGQKAGKRSVSANSSISLNRCRSCPIGLPLDCRRGSCYRPPR